MSALDTFTLQYIETLLWSESDEHGKPLEGLYSVDDLAPETLEAIKEDCAGFQKSQSGHIVGREELAGHDFCLTRNGHGAGFWDGDWPEEAGEVLTIASKPFGTMDLYVGDDGLLYHHN